MDKATNQRQLDFIKEMVADKAQHSSLKLVLIAGGRIFVGRGREYQDEEEMVKLLLAAITFFPNEEPRIAYLGPRVFETEKTSFCKVLLRGGLCHALIGTHEFIEVD